MTAKFRNCQLDAAFQCTQCGTVYAHGRIEIRCKEGGNAIKIVSKKKRRPRTGEEIEAVNAICAVCRYFTHGMCMLLIRKGCGSCKTAEDFERKIAKGIPCADKPPRFPATPLVE